MERFEQEALLIVAGGERFEHDGGESGINTFFFYDRSGDGLVILINSDMADDALNDVFEQVQAHFRR